MRQLTFTLVTLFSVICLTQTAQAQCQMNDANDHICGGGAQPAQQAAPATPAGTAINNAAPPRQTDYSDPQSLIAANPAIAQNIAPQTTVAPTPIAENTTTPISIPAGATTSMRFTPGGNNSSFTFPPGAGPLRVWISSIPGYDAAGNNLSTSQDYYLNSCYAMINNGDPDDPFAEDRLNIADSSTIIGGSDQGITMESDVVEGTVDLRASGAGQDLQNYLGLFSQSQVGDEEDLSGFTDLQDLMTDSAPAFAGGDSFNISFADPRITPAVAAQNYTLDLSDINTAYPIDGTTIMDATDQLVAAINGLAPAADPAFGVVASRGAGGELVINSRANITIDAAAGMGNTGLAVLGLDSGLTETEDPYIEVQVTQGAVQRVYIEPGDDETDLLNKLNALTGVEAIIDPATGFMTIHADDPGLSVQVSSSDHEADGTGAAAAGTSLLSTMFGSDQPYETVGDQDSANAWWTNCAIVPGQTYYVNVQNLSGQPVDTSITYGPQTGA